MDRVLTILEVSRKQDYIFSSKKLRENADRSNEIAYVTGSEFFRESAKNLYDEQILKNTASKNAHKDGNQKCEAVSILVTLKNPSYLLYHGKL